MTKTVSLYVANTHLSTLVEEAAAGAEVVIAKNGRPRAKLVPLPAAEKRGKRQVGFMKGQVWEAPDLDDWWATVIDEMIEGTPGDPLREDFDR